MRGTVEGTDVFLGEDALPAFTFSVNSILDLTKIQGVGSTTIKLIATKEARQRFGTEFMAQNTRKDRPQLLIGNGDPSVFRASVIPVRHTRNEIECISVAGNASWFDRLKDVKLREFNFGFSEPVTKIYQRATWSDANSLLLFPLIDFGSLEARTSGHEVDSILLRPAVFVRRILEEVFGSIDFQVVARGSFAEKWPKIYVIEPEAEPGVQVPNPYPVSYDVSTSTLDPDGPYFIPTTTGLGTVALVNFAINSPPLDTAYDGIQFKVVVYDFSAHKVLAEYLVPPRYIDDPDFGAITLNMSFNDVPMRSGNQIGVGVQAVDIEGLNPVMDVPSVTSQVHYTLGAQAVELMAITSMTFDLTDASVRGPYTIGTRLDIAAVCPDMSAADLLKAVVNNQCLAITTDTATKRIELWYDYEYFRKPVPQTKFRDWTDRIDQTTAPAKRFDEQPRRVNFNWKLDEEDRLARRITRMVGSPGFANAVVEIEDAYGPETSINLPFAPTAMAKTLGLLNVPAIRTLGETFNTDNYKREPRMLLFQGLSDGSWNHDGNGLTEYPLSVFGDATNKHALAFDNGQGGEIMNVGTVPALWSRRIGLYRSGAILEAHLFIRDHELQDFDHGLPTLVDDGSGPAWYWVQEIQQHRFGVHQPTKCILVQIPGKEVVIPQVAQPAITYPPQPFACIGQGYIPFTVGSDSSEVYMETSSGYFSIRGEDGGIDTFDSATSVIDLPAGSYCLWTSDENGDLKGDFLYVAFTGDIEALNLAGIEGMNISQLFIDGTPLTSLVVPLTLGEPTFNLDNSPLTSITFASGQRFSYISSIGAALTESTVGHIITRAYEAVVDGSALTSVLLNGGTSSAPPTSVDDEIAALTGGPGMTIADTGNANVDGGYDPNGTLNSRNAYIHGTNGITEVFWTGAQWRILAADAILDSYDDVAEPWLATTWILVSGTASDPTITGPGYGVTVTTN